MMYPQLQIPQNNIIVVSEEQIKKLFGGKQDEQAEEVTKEKTVKYKKNGEVKKVVCNKKKGVSSEVYPFEVPDIKKMMKYFLDNELYNHYLIFVLSCNMARRIGDTIGLKWKHFYNPKSGELRDNILEIVEDKTDKLANPRINSACRAAIALYLEKTGVNPSENNYENDVFIQMSGTYKGRTITTDGYRKALNKAAEAVGIKYNIGTHSPRKTFGYINKHLHPTDCDAMQILQTIYNHSDEKTTERYIGLTKEKVDGYYDDFGKFFDEYVIGDKECDIHTKQAVVSFDVNEIRELLTYAYNIGCKNSNCDTESHIATINEILKRMEVIKK